MNRLATLEAALRLVEARIGKIWAMEFEDVRLARAFIDRHPGLGARDLLHLASCTRREVDQIKTFDRALAAALPGIGTSQPVRETGQGRGHDLGGPPPAHPLISHTSPVWQRSVSLMNDQEPVTIARSGYRHETELAHGFLEDAGISAALFADDAGGAEVGLAFVKSSQDTDRIRRRGGGPQDPALRGIRDGRLSTLHRTAIRLIEVTGR